MNKGQTNRLLGYPVDASLLIRNADDFGMCHAINEAIFRAFKEGQTLCVDVSAKYLARFVALSIDDTDAVFSDNYFDVPAGTAVVVSTPLPENWTAESTVQAKSLYDSFA